MSRNNAHPPLVGTHLHVCTRLTHTHTPHSPHARTHRPSLPHSGLGVWAHPLGSVGTGCSQGGQFPPSWWEWDPPHPPAPGHYLPHFWAALRAPHVCALTGTQFVSQRGGPRESPSTPSVQPSPRGLCRAPGPAPGCAVLTRGHGPHGSPWLPPTLRATLAPPAASLSVSLSPAVSPACPDCLLLQEGSAQPHHASGWAPFPAQDNGPSSAPPDGPGPPLLSLCASFPCEL